MHWNEWGLCNWLFQDAVVGRESEQSLVPSLQMPSEACWRGLFSGLGSWVWARGEQMGGVDKVWAELPWPQMWEKALTPGSYLWPHSSPLLALCLIFWEKRVYSLFRSHHATFTGAQGVKKDAPGFTFKASMVVQMNQAPTHSTHKLWFNQKSYMLSLNGTFNESSMAQWCLESQRTSQYVSSSSLHPLTVHAIYWVYDLG